MSKRTILLLLMPNLLLLLIAAESFRSARIITPNVQITQRAIDKLNSEARRGDYGPNPDPLVERLSDSWRSRDVLQTHLAKLHMIAGSGVLAVVAVQVYLILRLNYLLKNGPFNTKTK